jgi:hypothetical protein
MHKSSFFLDWKHQNQGKSFIEYFICSCKKWKRHLTEGHQRMRTHVVASGYSIVWWAYVSSRNKV